MTRRRALLFVGVAASIALCAWWMLRWTPPAPPPPGSDSYGDPLPPYAVARIGTVRLRGAGLGFHWAADGREIVAGGIDGRVRTFDAATGAIVREFVAHEGVVELPWKTPRRSILDWVRPQRRAFALDAMTGFSASNDGRRALTLGKDTARLWDAASGKELRTFPGNPYANMLASFSDDSREVRLAVGRSTSFYDADTGAWLRRLDGLFSLPPSVTKSPDGRSAAGINRSDALEVWTLNPDALRFEVPARCGREASIAFSADSRFVAVCGGDVAVFDTATGARLVDGVPPLGAAHQIAFSPDGSRFAARSGDVVFVFDTATWKQAPEQPAPTSLVAQIAFSRDAARLATSNPSGGVAVWDARTGRALWAVPGDPASSNAAVAFARDNARVLVSASGSLVERDATTGAVVATPNPVMGELRSQLDSDPPVVLRRMVANDTEIVDMATGAVRARLAAAGPNSWMAVTRDGRRVVGARTDVAEGLAVWDAATGAILRSGVPPRPFAGERFATNDDGTLVAYTAMDDRRDGVAAADAATLAERAFLEMPPGVNGVFTVSPDGNLVVRACLDGSLHMFSVAQAREVLVLRGHTANVHCLTFSRDGRRLASASDAADVLVWDVSGFLGGR